MVILSNLNFACDLTKFTKKEYIDIQGKPAHLKTLS